MTVGIPRFLNFPFSGFGMGLPVSRVQGDISLTESHSSARENVLPKLFGCHSVHARSPFVCFDTFERQSQVLAAQYRLECDLRKSGLVLCGVVHFHHGRCALPNPSLPSVDTQIRPGLLCFLRLATLCLRHRTPMNSVLRQVLPCLL